MSHNNIYQNQDVINKYIVDNIVYFKYLHNQKVIIKNPNYVINIHCNPSGNIYTYGCFVYPERGRIINILKDYMYALDEYELFQFDEANFKITIKHYE